MATPSPTFPFNRLPKELRLEIWKQALPGPRIVYIQRYIYEGESPLSQWGRFPRIPYYGSPTSCNSLLALLAACKESSSVVKEHYTPLFGPAPSPHAWFDYENDYLFVDWGVLTENCHYLPRHLREKTYEDDEFFDRWGAPHVGPMIRKKVRNLAVGNLVPSSIYRRKSEERFMIEDVLAFFSGVRTVVLSDLLFTREQVGEELAWMIGDSMPDTSLRLREDQNWYNRDKEIVSQKEKAWMCARESILWRDVVQYRRCQPAYWDALKIEWDKHAAGTPPSPQEFAIEKGRPFPEFFRNSIVTAATKKMMLKGLGSEVDFAHLGSVDWAHVQYGDSRITGTDSEISRQIVILELALGCTAMNLVEDSQGNTNWDLREDDVEYLLARRDALKAELDRRELLIAEAEVMV